MKNVESLTAKNNLCTSCGICKAVCPKDCIELVRMGGQYVPDINNDKCIECGICMEICPGYKVEFRKLYSQINEQFPKNLYVGNYKDCFTAAAKNSEIRNNGVSGGCITAIVKKLLDNVIYDAAFLVDSYEYNKLLETNLYKKNDLLTSTTKSRYIPISHSSMISYVLQNKDKKVIVVATSCVVQGFLNVISKFKLNRDNYLILGLFCDKTMSYNVFEYFSDYDKSKSLLKNLHFRTKENGNWPGMVKLEYENGDVKFLPAEERMILKDYFQLERCMYCVDKLNQFADISLGDNYTGKDTSIKGNNSVIIRTNKGSDIWNMMKATLEILPSKIDDIYKSQHIDVRTQNYDFAALKNKKAIIDLYPDSLLEMPLIDQKTSEFMNRKLELIDIGRKYEYKRIDFHRRIKRIKARNFAGKLKRYIKRIIRGNK